MKMKLTKLKGAFIAAAGCAVVLLASCGGQPNQSKSLANDSIPGDTIPMDTLGGTTCFADENCNSPTCQDTIVATHSITQAKFDSMVTAYGSPPSKTNYTVSQLNTMMSGLDCTQGDCLAYSYVNGTGAIQLFAYPHTSTASFTGKFSLAYINGVKRLYTLGTNDVYEFHKAKNAANQQTVCIRCTKRGTPVFWGDRGDIYP